jgi:hypothetical protein
MRRDRIDAPLRYDLSIPTVRPYLNKSADRPATTSKGIEPQKLPGLVIDDAAAELVGSWSTGQNLTPHVGTGYRYAPATANAEARFVFAVTRTGRYEVRVAWAPHANRSTRTVCVIDRPGAPRSTLRLNQQQAGAAEAGIFHSVGRYDLESGKTNSLVLRTTGADGFVHLDAIQVVPVEE